MGRSPSGGSQSPRRFDDGWWRVSPARRGGIFGQLRRPAATGRLDRSGNCFFASLTAARSAMSIRVEKSGPPERPKKPMPKRRSLASRSIIWFNRVPFPDTAAAAGMLVVVRPNCSNFG